MKKITRNSLVDKPIIKIGYCAAHNLLKGLDRIGYMAGVYGWNADVYDAGGAYIVTGYRFRGLAGIYADTAILDRCEGIADFILNIWTAPEGITRADRLETVDHIRRDFVSYSLAAAGVH